MHDVALKRRMVALVIAALLAISGAALATAYFAAEDQAGTPNTGASLGLVGTDKDDHIRGGNDNDQQYAGYDGNDYEIYS